MGSDFPKSLMLGSLGEIHMQKGVCSQLFFNNQTKKIHASVQIVRATACVVRYILVWGFVGFWFFPASALP